MPSDFIWDFGKLPFPTHLGKYFIKIGKIRAKIHEIGKIKAIFRLGMTPIYGLKNGQIKSLMPVRVLKKSIRMDLWVQFSGQGREGAVFKCLYLRSQLSRQAMLSGNNLQCTLNVSWFRK